MPGAHKFCGELEGERGGGAGDEGRVPPGALRFFASHQGGKWREGKGSLTGLGGHSTIGYSLLKETGV